MPGGRICICKCLTQPLTFAEMRNQEVSNARSQKKKVTSPVLFLRLNLRKFF